MRYRYGADGVLYEKATVRIEGITDDRQYIGPYEYVGDSLDQIITSHGYIRLNREMLDTLSRDGDGELSIDIVYGEDASCLLLEPLLLPDILPSADSIEDSLWVVHYVIKDHLGNSRIIFKDSADMAVQISEHHYYPFGLEMSGDWTAMNQEGYDYRYNGKELQRQLDLGWYNYGARFYDPSIGRFMAVDPGASVYTSWSTYHYVYNNPLKYVDPTGAFIDYIDQSGNTIGTDGNDDGRVVVVTDRREVRSIRRTNRSGGTTSLGDVSSGVELPSEFVRGEMSKAVDRACLLYTSPSPRD